jgi:hypothetical protein
MVIDADFFHGGPPISLSKDRSFLVPKLPLGNAIGGEAPASLKTDYREFGEKAGAFSSIQVPSRNLETRKYRKGRELEICIIGLIFITRSD